MSCEDFGRLLLTQNQINSGMKLLGLIGGTSWYSTVEYYTLINRGVGKILGEAFNPELLLHSIDISVMRSEDPEQIRTKYLEVAKGLEAHGAKGIVICANTPHQVYDFVQPQINIPILHIAEAMGREAVKKGLTTLGLLGNRPTMTGDFISGYLRKTFEIETIIPEPHCISQAHKYVSDELTQGKFTEGARSFFMHQIDLLKARGAQGIILGCTELPLLIKQELVSLPVLATTDLHAQMAVDFILETK
jgi:aspartate racemase